MKLSEIIARLDKSKSNEDYVDLTSIAEEFGIYDTLSTYETERLKCYWIACHLCTDTWVGYRAYFFDGALVAVSSQSSRKSSEIFYWASQNTHNVVRDYIVSLTEKEYPDYQLLNMEEDLGEFYPIEYAGQFIRRDVLYKGKPARILNEKQYEFKEPSVLISVDNEERWVFPSEIQTPFNILGE